MNSICQRCEQTPERSGHALFLAIVLLTFCAVVTVTITQVTLKRYHWVDRQVLHAQADCLAESALLRAHAQLKQDASYPGETWNVEIPGDEFGPATAVIVVQDQRVEVEVLLPIDAPTTSQVRVRRQQIRE